MVYFMYKILLKQNIDKFGVFFNRLLNFSTKIFERKFSNASYNMFLDPIHLKDILATGYILYLIILYYIIFRNSIKFERHLPQWINTKMCYMHRLKMSILHSCQFLGSTLISNQIFKKKFFIFSAKFTKFCWYWNYSVVWKLFSLI